MLGISQVPCRGSCAIYHVGENPQAACEAYVQAVKSGEYPARSTVFPELTLSAYATGSSVRSLLHPSVSGASSQTVQIVASKAQVRAQVGRWREAGERVTLVPTMGALHKAHMDLARLAGRRGRVIVSIFVNPTQFAPGEDFERYPRDLDADADLLREAGVDLLFAPGQDEVYPRGLEDPTRVEVPGLSGDLCGAYRPTQPVNVGRGSFAC